MLTQAHSQASLISAAHDLQLQSYSYLETPADFIIVKSSKMIPRFPHQTTKLSSHKLLMKFWRSIRRQGTFYFFIFLSNYSLVLLFPPSNYPQSSSSSAPIFSSTIPIPLFLKLPIPPIHHLFQISHHILPPPFIPPLPSIF